MIRGLLKLILLVIVIGVVAAFLLGYDIGDFRRIDGPSDTVGTAGSERAREVGAEIGDRTSAAADATRRAIADGTLTSKIKAKMALDDTVSALNLDVDTRAGVVTVRGTVRSEAERQRALALARETDGVSQVIDQLQLK
ncbi:MAG TPA: BON domain-containing protein [Vicinamibacterales bacterium]|nr:BON domain-containing protein [Vicinamibacterales bacterium]